MNRIIEWMGHLYHMENPSLEDVLSRTWFYLTIGGLMLGTIILLVELTVNGRWRRRMSRASFGIFLAFTLVLMRSLVVARFTSDCAITQPWALVFWTYQVFSVGYFLYALILGRVIPAVWQFAKLLGDPPLIEKENPEDADVI